MKSTIAYIGIAALIGLLANMAEAVAFAQPTREAIILYASKSCTSDVAQNFKRELLYDSTVHDGYLIGMNYTVACSNTGMNEIGAWKQVYPHTPVIGVFPVTHLYTFDAVTGNMVEKNGEFSLESGFGSTILDAFTVKHELHHAVCNCNFHAGLAPNDEDNPRLWGRGPI